MLVSKASQRPVEQGEDVAAVGRIQLAGLQQPEQAGAHGRRSLEQLAADSGFSTAGPAELAPVLSMGGRVYR